MKKDKTKGIKDMKRAFFKVKMEKALEEAREKDYNKYKQELKKYE